MHKQNNTKIHTSKKENGRKRKTKKKHNGLQRLKKSCPLILSATQVVCSDFRVQPPPTTHLLMYSHQSNTEKETHI